MDPLERLTWVKLALGVDAALAAGVVWWLFVQTLAKLGLARGSAKPTRGRAILPGSHIHSGLDAMRCSGPSFDGDQDAER